MHNLRFLFNLTCIRARCFDYFSRFLLQGVSTTPSDYFVRVADQKPLITTAVEFMPFLKCPNHWKVLLRLLHDSTKACFDISKISLPVLPDRKRNLMHIICSSTYAIPPKSENLRRLKQYTHKDTCKNQTLPHPTTPLGTLTYKTPPHHTVLGNSWTSNDLRIMSNVLKLLDKPSYTFLSY